MMNNLKKAALLIIYLMVGSCAGVVDRVPDDRDLEKRERIITAFQNMLNKSEYEKYKNNRFLLKRCGDEEVSCGFESDWFYFTYHRDDCDYFISVTEKCSHEGCEIKFGYLDSFSSCT